ncbi:hypothetical protein Rvan_0508 [Rhodomicrobium vannielii ATCC 17100]|uniref:Uncharacterized protein n=1 Tax=Rhodomicrobium vannielii (strain ATCC 17100 / DSM 162 / LMG 4299 / NCIMB 10020 / ATH 3.1.1) TaxID=648757 RepID=E3HYP9_RHOVT|nr:hypothetical protein Rvan_0508 [Rhodomicrobium vannielii ATCC 17100]
MPVTKGLSMPLYAAEQSELFGVKIIMIDMDAVGCWGWSRTVEAQLQAGQRRAYNWESSRTFSNSSPAAPRWPDVPRRAAAA